MRKNVFRKAGACALSTALAATMVVLPAGGAAAETASSFWAAPDKATTIDSKLLTTYGVRAGSAGPDFLGISNTNFDFSAISPNNQKTGQYTGYTQDELKGVTGASLALWATSVNENVNPYYANLMYNALSNGTSTAATTYIANPEESSWGDSNGETVTIPGSDKTTISGLEYQPDIIFGANKATNWDNFDYTKSNIGKAVANKTTGYDNYNPTFANNDSTNLWTQIYTIGQLADATSKAKSATGKTTRYNSDDSALSYEKALRGNLLYIASQIDQGKAKKKTVAYLYAIDENDTGYFFVPEASSLVTGNDTGRHTTSAQETADTNYAANNGTIDLDYMDTLPFITNTFKNGTKVDGGIVMKVEDIWKSNPAVSVGSKQTAALKGVDTIIFNTTTKTNLNGTSGGRNSSGINNKAALTKDLVSTWAKSHGFNGTQVIAGDDFGTSNQQGFGTVDTTADGMSPMLYCQRNYTTDKPARAAWAFSKVYPDLYPNEDASYAYWVDKVYHINTGDVAKVVKYFTNQSDTVTYTAATEKTLEAAYQTGLNWWVNTGKDKAAWGKFAYYNGSSRASYYDSNEESEEVVNAIGIFDPSAAWEAKAQMPVKTVTVNVKKVTNAAVKKAVAKANTSKKIADASTVTSIVIGAKAKTIAAKAFKGYNKVTTVTIGKKVKKIAAKAFASSKVKTVILKSTKLTKKSAVKGAFKSSKVAKVKVKVAKKKATNKKYVKKYKKVLTKKIAGKKLTVRL